MIGEEQTSLKRVSSSSSISSLFFASYGNIYMNTWRCLLQLSLDPCPNVADMAKTLVNNIKIKVHNGDLRNEFGCGGASSCLGNCAAHKDNFVFVNHSTPQFSFFSTGLHDGGSAIHHRGAEFLVAICTEQSIKQTAGADSVPRTRRRKQKVVCDSTVSLFHNPAFGRFFVNLPHLGHFVCCRSGSPAGSPPSSVTNSHGTNHRTSHGASHSTSHSLRTSHGASHLTIEHNPTGGMKRSASAVVLGRYGGEPAASKHSGSGPVSYSAQFPRSRKIFDRGPSVVSS